MKKLKLLALLFLVHLTAIHAQFKELTDVMVDVQELIPSIRIDLRYFSSNNFVGDTIRGYEKKIIYLTKPAALQLREVQAELNSMNLGLLVYDAYRPQRAVNHFVDWARHQEDTIQKHLFYPQVNKRDLFKEGYIASRSGHSRGSTIDLTIITLSDGSPLDMGSPYDFFGPESWVNYSEITQEQLRNRQLLQRVMLKHGFRNYPKEWWHFTLRNEPFPDTYFEFPIRE